MQGQKTARGRFIDSDFSFMRQFSVLQWIYNRSHYVKTALLRLLYYGETRSSSERDRAMLVLLNISLSHSKSLNVIRNDTIEYGVSPN